MVCTGSSTATVAVNLAHLGSYVANFAGVNLAASCNSKVTEGASCLIAICNGSMVLQDSSVTWVHGLPLAGLECAVHNSRITIHNSTFANNQVRPLIAGDQAVVGLNGSTVSTVWSTAMVLGCGWRAMQVSLSQAAAVCAVTSRFLAVVEG
jgi:hypothetical protein